MLEKRSDCREIFVREVTEDLLFEIHIDWSFDEISMELSRLLLVYWTMNLNYH